MFQVQFLSRVSTGKVSCDNASDSNAWLLALATLGIATEIGSFLFFCHVTHSSQEKKIVCSCHWHFLPKNVADVHEPLMRSIYPLAAQFCMFDSGKHFYSHLIIVSKDINLPKWGGVCVSGLWWTIPTFTATIRLECKCLFKLNNLEYSDKVFNMTQEKLKTVTVGHLLNFCRFLTKNVLGYCIVCLLECKTFILVNLNFSQIASFKSIWIDLIKLFCH
jgi:hypothetical protein